MKTKIQTFDIIYSLGDSCAVALYMKQLCMRACSGPFDWLAGGDFKLRINLLINRFEGFLKAENLEPVREGRFYDPDGVHPHERFVCQKTGLFFIHDFDKNHPLRLSFPAVKEKYNRRVARMLHSLDTRKTLLIWFSYDQVISDEVVIEQISKLHESYGKNIHLLIVEHDDKAASDEIRHVQLTDCVERYYLYAKAYDKQGNLKTKGRKEALTHIFERYGLHDSIRDRRKRAAKACFIRLATALIPIKRIRKKLRKKYSDSNSEGD